MTCPPFWFFSMTFLLAVQREVLMGGTSLLTPKRLIKALRPCSAMPFCLVVYGGLTMAVAQKRTLKHLVDLIGNRKMKKTSGP